MIGTAISRAGHSIAILTVLSLPYLAGQPTPEANDWLLVPGVRVGPIHGNAVRTDLKRLFPQASIEDQELELEEGMVYDATMVARATPSESLAIVWSSKDPGAHPKEIFVCRGRHRGECKWHADFSGSPIEMGTKLSELEAINARPFTVQGFGWTYGGNVLSWDGGKIGKVDCHASLSLGLDGERASDGDLKMSLTADEKASFFGNRPISSTVPALKKLNPAVTEILFVFPGSDAKNCAR